MGICGLLFCHAKSNLLLVLLKTMSGLTVLKIEHIDSDDECEVSLA